MWRTSFHRASSHRILPFSHVLSSSLRARPDTSTTLRQRYYESKAAGLCGQLLARPVSRRPYFHGIRTENTNHGPAASREQLLRVPIVPLPSGQAIPPATPTPPSEPTPPITDPPPDYTTPTKGILSLLPRALVPFAELSRLDKPVGTYYLLLPCLFSTLLAAPLATPITPPTTLLTTAILFTAGATIMRGAGCTVNDIWDRRLDKQVSRTRLRPLARGAVSLPAAVVWLGVQCFAGLAVLLQFPQACFWYATPSLLLVGLYPAAKRVTNYPQFVLGLTFSWGAIVGFPALGVDLMSNGAAAAGLLYASNVAWTVLYDMVYAHQDIRDDKIAGIRSIARAHETNTKNVLAGLAVVQAGLLAGAGAAVGAGPVYYAGVCGAALMGNGLQIWRVKLEDPADCWWWFRNGVWITGGGIIVGLGAEYAMQYWQLYDQQDSKERIEEKAHVHSG